MTRRRLTFLVLLVLWCGAVWWLSSRSRPQDDLGFLLPDWLAHGIEYAAGGFLAFGVFRGRPAAVACLLAFGFCVGWGVLDEWHQSWVPGRDSALSDILADAVGACLGTLFHAALGPASRTPGG